MLDYGEEGSQLYKMLMGLYKMYAPSDINPQLETLFLTDRKNAFTKIYK